MIRRRSQNPTRNGAIAVAIVLSAVSSGCGTQIRALRSLALSSSDSSAAESRTYTAVSISSSTATITRAYSFRSLEGRRKGTQSTVLDDGTILVSGGCKGDSFYGSTKIYHPTTDRWTLAYPMQVPRCYHRAIKLSDGKVLAVGGLSDSANATDSAEIFDPASGKWEWAPPMNEARAGMTATSIDGGARILVAGGSPGNPETSNSALSTTEIYDVGGQSWSAGPTLSDSRFSHQSVSLADGSVLLVGGVSSGRAYLSSVEKFTSDSAGSGTIASAASMAFARADFGAVRLETTAESGLANGEGVLVGGGYDGSSNLKTLEIYDVVANAWTTEGSQLSSGKRYSNLYRYPSDGAVLVFGGSTVETDLYVANGDSIASKAANPGAALSESGIVALPTNGNVSMFYGDSSAGLIGSYPYSYDRAGNSWATLAQEYVTISANSGLALSYSNGTAEFCYGKDTAYVADVCTMYYPDRDGTLIVESPPEIRGDAYTGPSWVELSDGRSAMIGGGFDARNTIAIYDPSTDSWTESSAAPMYIGENKSVVLPGDRILVFDFIGGATGNYDGSSNYFTGTYVYDVGTDSWTDLSSTVPLPWGSTNYVSGSSLVVTSTGRIFIIGGLRDNDNSVRGDTYEFDPLTDTWTTRGSLAIPRAQAAAVSATVGGIESIYVASGCTAYSVGYPYLADSACTNTMERFDLTTNSWSSVGSTGGWGDWGVGMVYSPGDQSFFLNGWYETGLYRVPLSTNVMANVATAPATLYSQHQNARLADGRIILYGLGNDDVTMGILNVTDTARFTASGGSGDYSFSMSGGSGTFYPGSRIYVPSDSLPSETATVEVLDSISGGSDSATVTTP